MFNKRKTGRRKLPPTRSAQTRGPLGQLLETSGLVPQKSCMVTIPPPACRHPVPNRTTDRRKGVFVWGHRMRLAKLRCHSHQRRSALRQDQPRVFTPPVPAQSIMRIRSRKAHSASDQDSQSTSTLEGSGEKTSDAAGRTSFADGCCNDRL